MRYALAVAAVLACGKSHHDVHITIGSDALGATQQLGGHVVDVENDIAIVDIADDQLPALGERMHAYHRCGGFMVHDTLDDARAALHPHALRPAIDYTLDHADVVNAILPQLDRARILHTIQE